MGPQQLVPFLTFFFLVGRVPLPESRKKKGYPYSSLSAGGPSRGMRPGVWDTRDSVLTFAPLL